VASRARCGLHAATRSGRPSHGLGLVVRHAQHGDAQAALEGQYLAPHVGTELRVQVRQRLIHQADRSFGDDDSSKCDALLLAAGELPGCDRAGARCRGYPRRGKACVPVLTIELGEPSDRRRCFPQRSDEEKGRTIGTPSPHPGQPTAGLSHRARRSRSVLRSPSSSRPRCASRSSCCSRTGQAEQ
jgi:hypothetical protein